MSSLVERLRVRSERKPVYNLDDSDDDADLLHKKSGNTQEKIEKIIRTDAKDDSCQVCGGSENLLSCETCTYAYHAKCLLPPLKVAPISPWRCPECVSPLNDIEKILDCEMRPTVADDSDASKLGSKQIFVKQYLVKWKGLSYLHCTWVPEKEFVKAFKANPRLRSKINNFQKQMSSTNNSEDDFVAIRPEWTTVDRIIACRGDDDEKEYFVKWKELPYDECYWEFASDISSFQAEIEKFNRIRSRYGKSSSKKKNSLSSDGTEMKKKEFQHYEKSPEFLSGGGSLHPYQLEGLNFLRYAWSKQTHVILADEMGLGKTIQSIAFLASLYEENISPHLVVAPLSTLRNWEREFATWAPHMNVVMYVGGAPARAVIREYEFYYPKKSKKNKKKKKSGQIIGESKQDRIKFDVLLTSYEMINLDSASLKPIQWECMIVDEGHRLKNKDSKLFILLKQYTSRHRTLLTGTPLQNNLDELFMLMHFLDAGKFASLDEFQEEFKDINQEEQILRLHKMLAPHLLRRLKKDVMKELPPKKELILRVDLSSKQKEYYKAILTRNYQILTRRGGAQISLINVVMELRKLCCHAFMLEGVEPEDTNEFNKQLLESSGKLNLLDKLMLKLKEQGHRVLIYSQFQHMLDLLEDYCNYRNWVYERIDGKVAGAERQVRIDRFNAKSSTRFCFLLSTRAGGLGINLATADTVIIYDSDWNPHADLQAMARAHRLGQTNKVMIFRLVTRGTIEERMMQMTKKKMVLEHLVVGRLKAQNINQEELDDIIRYGSKELFADENDEAGKSRQIHYDDAAIDRLLNRDQVGEEEATSLDDEEEDGFLKAFKVANFEYIDEVQAEAKEEEQMQPTEIKSNINNSEKASYWEELLKDRYEVHKIEELNAMGKGKRSRKQMVSVEEDDLAGLEDVSSDGEDDNYEAELAAELTDGETASAEAPPIRKPYRKKARVGNAESLPLMEGEGRSFRVLGFTQNQRLAFVQILMRDGNESSVAMPPPPETTQDKEVPITPPPSVVLETPIESQGSEQAEHVHQTPFQSPVVSEEARRAEKTPIEETVKEGTPEDFIIRPYVDPSKRPVNVRDSVLTNSKVAYAVATSLTMPEDSHIVKNMSLADLETRSHQSQLIASLYFTEIIARYKEAKNKYKAKVVKVNASFVEVKKEVDEAKAEAVAAKAEAAEAKEKLSSLSADHDSLVKSAEDTKANLEQRIQALQQQNAELQDSLKLADSSKIQTVNKARKEEQRIADQKIKTLEDSHVGALDQAETDGYNKGVAESADSLLEIKDMIYKAGYEFGLNSANVPEGHELYDKLVQCPPDLFAHPPPNAGDGDDD